ncbi:MAG: ParB N-terminal domain-containing protein [Chromatiaceae bacterium]|nr:ParB N-terminal domain-containing protein [Chromatiaceae bacterium]
MMSGDDEIAMPDDGGRSHELANLTHSQPMMVPLERIHPYDRNPRQGNNPEYDRIKASIRTMGLDQPLTITQRPGASDYIVHSGGNTRLDVLNSLYAETGDVRYATVACLFKPWRCESEVVLAHLRENDLRGGLTFIDKARAVMDIKALLEAECQIEEISLRRLESALQQGGYALSIGLISRMGYAVHTLLPLIPKALHAGLGRPQVQKIRALERAARQLWEAHDPDANTPFDLIFATLCQRYDDPDWDTGLLRNALESEIAEQAEISVHVVRMELDARIEGRRVTIPPPDEEQDSDEDEVDWLDKPLANIRLDFPAPLDQESVDTSNPTSDELPPDSAIAEDRETDPVPESLPENDVILDPAQNDFGNPDAAAPDELPAEINVSTPTDLKSLRACAWTLATRLAQRNGLSDLVVPLSGKGLGFMLCDVPDPALADELDEESLSQLSLVWWQLAACAELTLAPLSSIIPHLRAESVLRQALEQQDLARIYHSVWTLDPGQTGHRLWRRLGERDWTDLLSLMESYRRIHLLAEERQLDLWAPS